MPIGLVLFAMMPSTIQVAHADQTAQTTSSYHIPAGPLTETLNRFAVQSGLLIVGNAELTRDKQSEGVLGSFTFEQALKRLLEGGGLVYQFDGERTVTLTRAASINSPIELAPITVEGRMASGTAQIGNLPPAYAGGQVATGARVGVLGNKNIFDTPYSITSFTEQLIQNREVRYVGELSRLDAGIYESDPKTGGTNIATSNLTIRGFYVPGHDNLFNGLPLHDRTDPIVQFERVEVLKGPSALLNGQIRGVGGVINYVPKRAPEEGIAEVTARYQSKSNGSGHVDVGRRFGENKEWGVRVNAFYQDGEIGIDEISPESQVVATAIDYLGENLRASLDLDYSREAGNFNPRVTFKSDAVIPDPPSATSFYGQKWGSSERELMRAVAAVEYDVTDNWTVSLSGGATQFEWPTLFANAFDVDSNGDYDMSGFAGNYFEDRLAGEIAVRGDFDTGPLNHATTVSYQHFFLESGFDANSFDGLANNIFNPVFYSRPSVQNPGRPNKTFDQTIRSVALTDVISVLEDRVSLILGARRTSLETRSFDSSTGSQTDSYDVAENTPSLGVVVKPFSGVSLYGNYIEALEAGGTAPINAANAGEALPAAVSEQLEIGVKYDGGDIGATLALFQIERPSGAFDTDTNIFALDAEQRNRGIELSVFGNPIDYVRVLGGFTFIDAELTKTEGGENQGNTPPGVPKFGMALHAELDVPGVTGLTLVGGLKHTGAVYADRANQQEFPSYTLLDFGARYDLDIGRPEPITIRATVQNVTDENYWIGSVWGEATVGPPRTFLLSTSFRF